MHRLSDRALWVSACFATVFAATAIHAQNATSPAPSSTSSSAQVDSTKTNQRDRSGQTTTPFNQPNDKADVKLAAAVRRAVVKNKSLSTSAHNVKIVVTHGTVTLRGPVKTDDEKAQVESTVKGVPGVSSVNNELDVEH